MGAPAPLAANPDQEAPSLGMHVLDVELRRGHNLAARDRGGEGIPTKGGYHWIGKLFVPSSNRVGRYVHRTLRCNHNTYLFGLEEVKARSGIYISSVCVHICRNDLEMRGN